MNREKNSAGDRTISTWFNYIISEISKALFIRCVGANGNARIKATLFVFVHPINYRVA